MFQAFVRFLVVSVLFGASLVYASFTPDVGSMPVSGANNWHTSTTSYSSSIQFQGVRNIRTTATSPRLLYINNTANSITFQASVRKGYNGTIEMVLVGGSSTITIPAYSSVLSDVLSFNVTAGDFIYDRSFFSLSGATSISSQTIYSNYNPEGASVSGSISGLALWGGYVYTATSRLLETNKTFEHDIPSAAMSVPIFSAYAIVGVPTDSSVRFTTLIGDSKTVYASPDYNSGSGKQWGQYGLGVVSGAPYQDLAYSGDTLSGFLSVTASNALRRELLTPFGGDVINHYGTNSVGNAAVPSTAATSELSLISQLKSLLTGDQRLFQVTLDPTAVKSSGASWTTITEGEQTGGGNSLNGIVVTKYLNDILRTSKPSYIDGVIDLGAVTQTANGYWKPSMTGDGIHQGSGANVAQGAAFAAVWPAPLVSQSISAISATPSSTGSSLSWTTGRASSTFINYGTTSSYGSSTSETDTSTRVLSHSVSLSSLQPCTRYHYQVDGYDGYFSRGASSDQTFTTTGCTAGASVLSSGTDTNITTASGGTINFGSAQIVVPASFTGSASSAVFQAKQLDPTTFYNTIATPGGKYRAGTYILNLKALTSPTDNLSTFTNPITVTLPYADEDVTTISVPSLKIQRYDDGVGWTELDSCSVNTVAKTVTCTTTHFSDFALFGDPGDSTGPVVSSLVVTPSTTGATITFDTNEGGTTSILYGSTSSYGSTSTISSSLLTSHSGSIAGLSSCGSVYHYSIRAVDTLGNISTTSDATFVTHCGNTSGGGGYSPSLPSVTATTDNPNSSNSNTTPGTTSHTDTSTTVPISSNSPTVIHPGEHVGIFHFLSEDPTILSSLQSIYGADVVTETVYKNQCETNQGKPYYRTCKLGVNLPTFDLFRDSVLCEGFITEQPTEKDYRFSDTASRKEVVGIAVKMKKIDGKNVALVASNDYQNIYADIGLPGEASWIQPIAETGLKYGIVSSARKFFEPDRQVTRAEAYAMIMNSVCMLPKESNLNTEKSWQELLYNRASIEGLTNKAWESFDSEKPILRQELFVLASKVSDWAERTGGCDPKPEFCFMPSK